jgi:ferric-dicitrate binding protein FerR (iron transport regulator)
MSSTFAPVDAATIAGLNAGSEQALEKIFRDNYAWLLDTALVRLKGEDAAAPKLLVATVREFWDERDGFHSSAEIESFFNEEFRHRARAVRARMASVHRFEKVEGVRPAAAHAAPTPDSIWNEIATEMHKPVVDAATVAKRRREARSHEVAEHINTVTQRASWKTPAIIVTVATILALAGAAWFTKRSHAEVVDLMLASADAQQLDARAGQIGSVTLGDQTVARIGPESRLTVVKGFGAGEYRTLRVNGTASFAVAAGGSQPFDARLGEVSVTSKGGGFTVRDYAEENIRMVRVDSGEVVVSVAGTNTTLKAGDALTIDRAGQVSTPDAALVKQELSWTDSRLVLNNQPVSYVVQKLWRWYGMDIAVLDSTKLETPISIDVELGSTQGAISAIEAAAGLKFEWVDGKMTFQPKAK